jgi:hypothetical protein
MPCSLMRSSLQSRSMCSLIACSSCMARRRPRRHAGAGLDP